MIGIFDSGIGGLTTVKELLRQRPLADYVYVGDTARMPYGNKNPEVVTRYLMEGADFLRSQGATCLVIACNSASAVAAATLRARDPFFPVFEVITPAVEKAVCLAKKRMGVIGTRATIASGAYERALRERGVQEIVLQACPLLVPLIEEGWLEHAETKRIVKHYLRPLRHAGVEAVILGCTHYPLLRPLIQRYMGNQIALVDSGAAVVASMLETMGSRLSSSGMQTHWLTDVSPQTEAIARKWLGRDIRFETAEFFEQGRQGEDDKTAQTA